MDLPGHADEVSRCFDKIELVINNIVVLLITEYKERTETMMHVIIHYQVYTVDWSPDGEKVASGGKDRVLKLWMN